MFVPASSLTVPSERIPFSLLGLTEITNGGLLVGRVHDIVGEKGTGKSTLALDIIANAQRQGHPCYLVDAEYVFDPVYARALGVDLASLSICQTNDAEDVFATIRTAAATKRALIILDSIGFLLSRPEADVEDYTQTPKVASRAVITQLWLKHLLNIVYTNHSTVVIINQYRANISTLSRIDKKPAGSFAYHHAITTRIELQISAKHERGVMVDAKVTKNRAGPVLRATTYLLPAEGGLGIVDELMTRAVAQGVITRNGAYYTYNGHRVHGRDEAVATFPWSEIRERLLKEQNHAVE